MNRINVMLDFHIAQWLFQAYYLVSEVLIGKNKQCEDVTVNSFLELRWVVLISLSTVTSPND